MATYAQFLPPSFEISTLAPPCDTLAFLEFESSLQSFLGVLKFSTNV
ncbi:hypothetical protein HanPSC8_Chr04g0172291 [Helianthus annuus]|nr:hypothetical protein HanPSC8_Chr04g0172291 [Helianthus annuus]